MPKNSTASSDLAETEEPGKPVALVNTRRWRRYQLDVPVRVIVHTPDKTKLHDGRGNELSEGGMAVTAGVELKPGDEVAIEFTPPYSGSPIRVRGAVRNRAGYRYGVEFLIGTADESDQVNRLRLMLQTLSHE
ncbi:MAG: PilZ domain-containing protein [Acidobacteriia bacterium]|nr:PilZ domain-containing protein [Terriglobia bacterium]